MQKLAAKLTEKLLRRRLISPEQSEWCAYLVECKLEQLLCFSVLITLGCLIAPLCAKARSVLPATCACSCEKHRLNSAAKGTMPKCALYIM